MSRLQQPYSIFSCLFYFSFPAFLDISGPLFRSSYSQQSKGVEEPQNRTSNVQNRDSKSKRDTKNSILVSISGNMAKKFSDSLCSSENHFGLYFQKTRPEIYYFGCRLMIIILGAGHTKIFFIWQNWAKLYLILDFIFTKNLIRKFVQSRTQIDIK